MRRTNIAQVVLIAFLSFALIAPISIASAGTEIALQGQIEGATIDIAIDNSNFTLDIAAGQTEASDTTTVTSTALIPVKMTLESFAHKAEGWSPTLIAADPTTLGLVDAQSQARFTLNSDTDDTDYKVAPPSKVTPTGTGATVDGGGYPVQLGTIQDTDGTVGKSVSLTGKLEASKKRILSKAFNSGLVLNFEADE